MWWAKPGYGLSFFFWLDILAVISLLRETLPPVHLSSHRRPPVHLSSHRPPPLHLSSHRLSMHTVADHAEHRNHSVLFQAAQWESLTMINFCLRATSLSDRFMAIANVQPPLAADVFLLFKFDLWSALIVSDGGLAMARAGRAARAGTRAVKIVRVIKLITLSRKARKRRRAKGSREEEDSKIGGRLADGITQKVIIIVGMMLFTTSLLDLCEICIARRIFLYSCSLVWILAASSHRLPACCLCGSAARACLRPCITSWLTFPDSVNAVTDADFSTSLRTLEQLYDKCGGRYDAGNYRSGCSNATGSCVPGVETKNPTCHFNVYFRSIIVEHNDDFGGICAYIDRHESPDKFRACKISAFDRYYNFATYTWTAECKKQSIRWLRVWKSDLFCNEESTYNLRTSPEERLVICRSDSAHGCDEKESSSSIVFSNIGYAQGQAVVNIVQVPASRTRDLDSPRPLCEKHSRSSPLGHPLARCSSSQPFLTISVPENQVLPRLPLSSACSASAHGSSRRTQTSS